MALGRRMVGPAINVDHKTARVGNMTIEKAGPDLTLKCGRVWVSKEFSKLACLEQARYAQERAEWERNTQQNQPADSPRAPVPTLSENQINELVKAELRKRMATAEAEDTRPQSKPYATASGNATLTCDDTLRTNLVIQTGVGSSDRANSMIAQIQAQHREECNAGLWNPVIAESQACAAAPKAIQ